MKRHQILLLHIATSILVLFPFPIHAHKMMYQDSIEIVVHRGANHIAPENTIPSALAALKHGAGWIEVDVRKSKDNILYNLHDETLDRTTNGKGPIQDMLSKDIEKLDAGSWFSSRFTGIHVPRIAEMLDTLQGKAHIFFDVKRGTPIKDLITLAVGKKISVTEACEYLSSVGLCARDYINREVDASLSGGELKRIEIATVLARGTKLSVFDEPEAGIDLWSFQNLIHVFEGMQDKLNGSILIISHQERILDIADKL